MVSFTNISYADAWNIGMKQEKLMHTIMELAKAADLSVIEDAAQMPGAVVDGRKAGTWGDIGILSFGGSKLLSAGRGGALLTSNPVNFQRMKLHCHRGNHAFALS